MRYLLNWSGCRLLSEDIGKRLKAQELASTAQDLARSQERLMESLEKLQSGDKNIDSIMKQISELAKTLASLQQALSQFAQQMPDDFSGTWSPCKVWASTKCSRLWKKFARNSCRAILKARGNWPGAIQSNGLDGSVLAERAALGHGLEHGSHARRNGALSQRVAGDRARAAGNLDGDRGVNKSALSERDAALKGKLDRF